MTPEQKEKIQAVVESSMFGVVATNSGGGAPESAVIGVSNTPQLEFVFGCFNDTRKFKNIAVDPRISLVVGWDKAKTVQIEGTAEVVSGEERQRLEDIHCAKNNRLEKFRTDPRQQYIKVTPKWIRYSDYSINPQEVWEVVL